MINTHFEHLEGEIWVPLLREYEISNMGRVVSNKGRRPRVMRTYLNNRNYHVVHLRVNNKRIAYTVHRLVGLIFLKNIDPKKDEVNHNHGKNDNRAQSLSWMTSKENAKHASDNLLYTHGDKHHKTTLDKIQVKVIRAVKDKLRQWQIATYFNISRASVDAIQNNKTWRHV